MLQQQHQVLPQLCCRVVEKRFGEVFAAPGTPTGAVLLVEAMHAAEQSRGDRLSHHWSHLQARGLHGLALAFDVAALVGVETAEVGLEIGVTLVAPQALLIQPGGAPRRLRQRLPGRIHIQEVAAENLMLAAEGIDQLQHQRRERRRILTRRGEKAIAHHRAHRAHTEQLGVVAQAQLAGEVPAANFNLALGWKHYADYLDNTSRQGEALIALGEATKIVSTIPAALRGYPEIVAIVAAYHSRKDPG